MDTTIAPPIDETLRPVLEQVRKDLLDFGMRNPLLNYRLLKSKGVESVALDPAPFFYALVTEGRELGFCAAQLAAKANKQLLLQDGKEPQGEIDTTWRSTPATQEALWSPERFSEDHFIANHTEQDLEKRLLATHYAARASVEEQGVNTLFVALGMLKWRDPSAPDDEHRAPLLLVPVELERHSASEGFRLRYSNDDVSPNICLIEFLKQFNVKVELPTEDEEFDLERYFQRFDHAVSTQANWTVDPQSIVLGFFSFSKFLMYRDLDPSLWPGTSGLLNHDVLQRLLGSNSFAGDGSRFSESDFLDDLPGSSDLMHVLDADSTQTLALMDANSGKSMVIQGPPGTGKSQTIVNLIANALAIGKTVLFVSEKKAALEVVKARLDKCGLGNACLELHSNKAKKKEVIAELKQMMYLDVPPASVRLSDQVVLQDARERLNKYCSAVNRKIGSSGERALDLFGQLSAILARFDGREIPQLDLQGALEWSEIETEQKRLMIRKLQSALSSVGVPESHPFWGTRLRLALPATLEKIRHALSPADLATQQFGQACVRLTAILGAAKADSPAQGLAQLHIAQRLIEAPLLVGFDLSDPTWRDAADEISSIIDSGMKLEQTRSEWAGRLQPEAWNENVSSLHDELTRFQSKWWRFLLPEWRSAQKTLGDLMTGPRPKGPRRMLEVTSAILTVQRSIEVIREQDPTFARLFGAHWAKDQSNWGLLKAQFDWISGATNQSNDTGIPRWGLHFVTHCDDRSALQIAIDAVTSTAHEFKTTKDAVIELLEVEDSAKLVIDTSSFQAFSTIDATWKALADSIGGLPALVTYLQTSDECRSKGLAQIADLADRWELGSTHLLDAFDYWRASALIDKAFERSPELATFDASSHSDCVETFRNLDSSTLHWTRAEIAQRHSAAIPATDTSNGQLGYLRNMFERKSRYPAIRKLIEKSGHAIQAFKPVFMMSPLSVANFLPPDSLRFDIVIFDEASQVRPADALGAIARGKQAIVVGDSKQLPPTSFFDSLSGTEEDDDADEGPTTDIESVLGLFCARSAHQRMLRWHYRSRHESLIAGSNHFFYDNRLVVFPSPEQKHLDLGLIYHRVPDAPYDRSRTRTNPGEARAVAEAVIRFAEEQLQVEKHSRLTLGVATFSVAQRDEVRNQVELLRRGHPNLEEFFAGPPHEPFFVKNLENVQGDERDAIFISVGYGRTKEGYLSMGFGPINRNGGERRLNVLFSRARKRCEVFTTLSADDIDVSGTPSAGLRALKNFLYYAEHGQIELPYSTGRGPDSPFEEEVIRTLQMLNYTVETQVGCAGFFIDIAVLDASRPGRYIIGIECDGASYHSARSARDRDRLRQAVLEGLGWKLHRIWSTAWFRERDREIDRLVQAIESAKADVDTSKTQVEQTSTEPEPEPQVTVATPAEIVPARQLDHLRDGVTKYQLCHLQIDLQGSELHLISAQILMNWLSEVVQAEGPIHWMEAARRIANSAGVQRVGHRIQDAIKRASKAGARKQFFAMEGDFLVKLGQQSQVVRDRSELPPQMKKLSLVAPIEIDEAIKLALGKSYGIGFDEAAVAACRLLGFARVTEDMQTIAERRRDFLLARGLIEQRGEMLFLRTASEG